MRKTTILAIVTAALAAVTIITDLIRAEAGPLGGAAAVNSVSHVRTTGILKAPDFDAI
ncbi:MAG TPA: hypothetical protein VFA57_09080 [Pseudolabrys sp.]|jgi:hypothetical protein|nr:hypothetical protein [Pseudolabrys sp.]